MAKKSGSKPMTKTAASRIQSAAAKRAGDSSFARRAQSAAARNTPSKGGSKPKK